MPKHAKTRHHTSRSDPIQADTTRHVMTIQDHSRRNQNTPNDAGRCQAIPSHIALICQIKKIFWKVKFHIHLSFNLSIGRKRNMHHTQAYPNQMEIELPKYKLPANYTRFQNPNLDKINNSAFNSTKQARAQLTTPEDNRRQQRVCPARRSGYIGCATCTSVLYAGCAGCAGPAELVGCAGL